MADLKQSMEHLLNATGSVWELRVQAEEELRTTRQSLDAMTVSYARMQRENERLRGALQDILSVEALNKNTGIRLIVELALHPHR